MSLNITVYPDTAKPDVGALAWRDGQQAVIQQVEDRVQRVVNQFVAISRAAGHLDLLIKDAQESHGALNGLHQDITREKDLIESVRDHAALLHDNEVRDRTYNLVNQLSSIDALIDALGSIDPQVRWALVSSAPEGVEEPVTAPAAPTPAAPTQSADLRDYMFRLLGEYRKTKPTVDGLVYGSMDRQRAEEYVQREPVHHLIDGSLGTGEQPYWWVVTTDFVRFCKRRTTPDQPIPIWQPPPPEGRSSNAQPPHQSLLYRVYELNARYRERNRPFKGIIYAEAGSADARLAARSLEAMGEWAVIAQNLSIAGPQETWLVVSKRFVEFMREQDPDLLRQLSIWTPEPAAAPVPPPSLEGRSNTPAPEAPTVPNSPVAEIARLAYDVRAEQLATGYKVFPSSLAPVARRFKNREKAEDMRLAAPGLYALLDQDMSAYDPSGMSWWVLNRWFVEWLREHRPKLALPLWDPVQIKEHHA